MTQKYQILIISLIMGFNLYRNLVVITASDRLTPEEIIDFCVSGMAESEIISQIQIRGIGFEVNLPVMQRFIEKGVSPGIIEVILGNSPSTSYDEKLVFTSLSEASSSLFVVTDPPGIKIFIDGLERGVTPFLSNKIDEGKHMVRAEYPLFFTREQEVEIHSGKDIDLVWTMTPREPLIRIRVQVSGTDEKVPWTWIIRPRENCPDPVSLKLRPWVLGAKKSEAIFVLSNESKRLYRGSGQACLEVFFWRGKIRKDLDLKKLPPCTARYFISDIQIQGIRSFDMTLNVHVIELDPDHPEITLDSSTGRFIATEDRIAPVNQETLKNRLMETFHLE